MVWQLLVAQLIVMALSYALRPKPPEPPPAGIDDFDVPTASASDPMPLVFGKRKVTPNVCWYGDLVTRKVKTKSGK